MENENVKWLTTVPASDVNFKSHLEIATDEEIGLALDIMTGQGKRGNASRIAELSKELRKRARERAKQ